MKYIRKKNGLFPKNFLVEFLSLPVIEFCILVISLIQIDISYIIQNVCMFNWFFPFAF